MRWNITFKLSTWLFSCHSWKPVTIGLKMNNDPSATVDRHTFTNNAFTQGYNDRMINPRDDYIPNDYSPTRLGNYLQVLVILYHLRGWHYLF